MEDLLLGQMAMFRSSPFIDTDRQFVFGYWYSALGWFMGSERP